MQIGDLHYQIGGYWLFKGLAAHFCDGITGISGANGCGKSTLLRILAGLCQPDKGFIKLKADDLYVKSELKKTISYVSSDAFLYPHLSVIENLYLIAMTRQMTKQAFDSNVELVLNNCQLNEFKHVLFAKCSDGVKKRCMLATALIVNPTWLILDEPCASLSSAYRKHLWDILKNYALQGTHIIIASHHLEEISPICSQHYLLHQGQLTLQSKAFAFSQIELTQMKEEITLKQESQ